MRKSRQQHGSRQGACGKAQHGRPGRAGTGEAAAGIEAGARAPCQAVGRGPRDAAGPGPKERSLRRAGAAGPRPGGVEQSSQGLAGERPPGRQPDQGLPSAQGTRRRCLLRSWSVSARSGGSGPRPARADPPPGQAEPGQAAAPPPPQKAQPGPARPPAAPPAKAGPRLRDAVGPFPPRPAPFPLYLPSPRRGPAAVTHPAPPPSAAPEPRKGGRGGRVERREGGARSLWVRGCVRAPPAQVIPARSGPARPGSARLAVPAACPLPRRRAPAASGEQRGAGPCCSRDGAVPRGGRCAGTMLRRRRASSRRGLPLRDRIALKAPCRFGAREGPVTGAGLRGSPGALTRAPSQLLVAESTKSAWRWPRVRSCAGRVGHLPGLGLRWVEGGRGQDLHCGFFPDPRGPRDSRSQLQCSVAFPAPLRRVRIEFRCLCLHRAAATVLGVVPVTQRAP
ncbi:proline-rich protein 2-like [Heliangelus exortis]|uniref:proline-rich protein 2-like n=1 Tax=Heliangelus exortis TaxID=472823 RepID=UPI003A90EB59